MYCLENDTLTNTLEHQGIINPNFSQVNEYIGRCLNEHSSAYRYSGTLNVSPRKRAVNLNLFRRLMIISCSLSQKKEPSFVESAMDDRQQLMHRSKSEDYCLFTMSASIRDPLACEVDIHKRIMDRRSEMSMRSMSWLTEIVHTSIISKIDSQWGPSAWILKNGSSNIDWVRGAQEKFRNQYRRRAFTHHYFSVGME